MECLRPTFVMTSCNSIIARVENKIFLVLGKPFRYTSGFSCVSFELVQGKCNAYNMISYMLHYYEIFPVPLWEKAAHRLPILKDVQNPVLTNSPDNFTPDGRWILGETPEVFMWQNFSTLQLQYSLCFGIYTYTQIGNVFGFQVTNYFVSVGMNGNSLQGAGGIGKAMAEWIIEGVPTTELIPFSVQRFLDLHNNRQYLLQRVREVVGR